MDTAVYALTATGAVQARELASGIGAQCFVLERYAAGQDVPFRSLGDLVAGTFSAYRAHVFVAATGIVVRVIAPLLRSKAADPAVVVVDQNGRFAISLVSGHLGGANELARLVGEKIGATPVITTATDCAGTVSIDLLAVDNGLAITDTGPIRHVNAALLDGERVALCDPGGFLDLSGVEDRFYNVEDIAELGEKRCGVLVDWHAHSLPDTVLALYPRCLSVGVGCRRGTPSAEILELVGKVFAENGIARESVFCMSSIEAKADEPGLIEAAGSLGLELKFYSAEELGEITVANPSGMVMKHMGVNGVCEAAAMKTAGATELLVPKTKSARVTVAVALAVSG
ncbi:cobalt-precorrin 5A hydrolase [Maridesulfovibrio sp.]|uniref:cobalt-precorrin 5A hydrolase n=1 Tax=Maridesulfovibrio sp. TaxID=2795000 RepID=UPI002A188BA3|nr:cobalt-precorrin 5A hydrolase [Maridesulfovibrio sp.]